MAMNNDATASANRNLAVIAVVLVLVGGYVALKWHTPFVADGMGGTWDAAVQRSRTAHRPSLVVFTADWCPGCQALYSDVLSRGDVIDEIDNHYTMTTVDMTRPSHAAGARSSKYGVRGIPTLIRFDAEGNETARMHYLPPEQMLAWLRAGE